MAPITIPKALVKEGDLVLIPRREYEDFLRIRKFLQAVKPTAAEKRAIARGRHEVRKKAYSRWALAA